MFVCRPYPPCRVQCSQTVQCFPWIYRNERLKAGRQQKQVTAGFLTAPSMNVNRVEYEVTVYSRMILTSSSESGHMQQRCVSKLSRKPSGYWDSLNNQRLFFDEVAEKFKIRQPSDWSKCTYQKLVKEGGAPLLRRYTSLVAALRSVYPEYEWDNIPLRTRMPRNHWNKLENQRKFFNELQNRYNIKQPEDWTNITYKQVVKDGGGTILKQYSSLAKP